MKIESVITFEPAKTYPCVFSVRPGISGYINIRRWTKFIIIKRFAAQELDHIFIIIVFVFHETRCIENNIPVVYRIFHPAPNE